MRGIEGDFGKGLDSLFGLLPVFHKHCTLCFGLFSVKDYPPVLMLNLWQSNQEDIVVGYFNSLKVNSKGAGLYCVSVEEFRIEYAKYLSICPEDGCVFVVNSTFDVRKLRAYEKQYDRFLMTRDFQSFFSTDLYEALECVIDAGKHNHLVVYTKSPAFYVALEKLVTETGALWSRSVFDPDYGVYY